MNILPYITKIPKNLHISIFFRTFAVEMKICAKILGLVFVVSAFAKAWEADVFALTLLGYGPEWFGIWAYGGGLTPPANIPQKTGYTFRGWRVRSCFSSYVCGLTSSDVDSLSVDTSDNTAAGYYAHNGSFNANANLYGLSAGEWAVKFADGSIVRGIASCNNTQSNTWYTIMTTWNWESDDDSWENVLWGSCSSDAIKNPNSSTFTKNTTGQHCWCKTTSYTPYGGNTCNVTETSAVFAPWDVDGDESACLSLCAGNCVGIFDMTGDNGRRAMFGVMQ